MQHYRQMPAGPMAATAASLYSRKSSAFVSQFAMRPLQDDSHYTNKEVVSVQTTTAPERPMFTEEQPTVYEGPVNLISIIDTNKDIICLKYTEDMTEIAAGFADGVIRLFDLATGKCKHVLVDDEIRETPGPTSAIQHRPLSRAYPMTEMMLSTYVNGCIKCWKYKYDQCLYTIREKRQTLGISYHPRFSKFITYGDDATLIMYDEEAQTKERAFYSSQKKDLIDGHTDRIFACAFHPKSYHELVTGGWDSKVMCWDDRQPFITRYFSGVHMSGEGIDFDHHGNRLLTCAWQDTDSIQIWDYGSCKLIETIVPDEYTSKLYCGKFAPSHVSTPFIVCGGSDEHMFRVVDLNTKKTRGSIRHNPGPIYALDIGLTRKRINRSSVHELQQVPRISFITGHRLQTVDFG